MDAATGALYEHDAARLAARYESADMAATHRLLLRHLPDGGKVLDIGCGSGRDAAMLLRNGFDVQAADPSGEMLAAAQHYHPVVSDRLHRTGLPLVAASPLLERRFDGVVCMAVIMHVPDQDLFEAAAQLRDLLTSDGVLVLSTSVGREGLVENRDALGRLFVERPLGQLQLLFERLGFRSVANYVIADGLGRALTWHTLVLQRLGGRAPRAVDELETIIARDRKDATYKLAVLRALCDIAQTQPNAAAWRDDGTVSIPLGLVAEKWLFYYWPIVELDRPGGPVVIPQKRGLEVHKPIAFRRAVRDLVAFYRAHGGMSSLFHDYRSGTVPAVGRPLLDEAINAIARTIVAGPVRYAGGALADEGAYFGFVGRGSAAGRCTSPDSVCKSLGSILVPAPAWREMCLIGHWIAESLILRWAELTHEIAEGSVAVKDVVERLLICPETERDVHLARSVYQQAGGLQCAWTGASLGTRFAVDHAVPFSIWHSNDLWNLLPAAMAVNTQKSDRLVSKRVLLDSRNRIVHCWEVMRAAAESRFSVEVSRALLRGHEQRGNWQQPAFAGLVETVETLAMQRGLQRWPE